MIPELIVLGMFLLVFFFDTFGGAAMRKTIGVFTTTIFCIGTLAIWWLFDPATTSCFSGMYVNTATTLALKTILNIGVFIVHMQSLQWTSTDEMGIRRAEFY